MSRPARRGASVVYQASVPLIFSSGGQFRETAIELQVLSGELKNFPLIEIKK